VQSSYTGEETLVASDLLAGTSVVVAGAGLAGLASARDLEADRASVTLVEARDRVGGRVWTIRDGFRHHQHAEAGADLIEGDQAHVRELVASLHLDVVRILRTGWGFYGPDRSGRRRIHSAPRTFEEAARRLKSEIRDFTLAGGRWDSAVALALGRTSVADWLAAGRPDAVLAAGLRSLRGFFLADPEDLSLIELVEQFASGDTLGDGQMFRLRDGNDRLPRAMSRALRGPIVLNAVVTRVTQGTDSVRVTIDERGTRRELQVDFCVCALPASTLRDVQFEPALPDDQHRAIATLRYGPATRLLLQFERRFWQKPRRPYAFGTDLPTGAVWDGNEQQRGPAGILTLLAGGRASGELQTILRTEGERGVTDRLAWLGKPASLEASRAILWEADPWARGGYAFFDPQFDPRLRAWLARPSGRVVFAGEHTSDRWQGYMNGAIESGRRAAAEIRAMVKGSKGS
jgi:monoamine oxidase